MADEPAVRVLLIDDEADPRLALNRTLTRLGYAVFEAGDAAAGLLAIAEDTPDVIFLDLRMPGMDGLTFMRTLNSERPDDQPPVIVMSGHGNMDDVIEVLRSGAIDYIRKPWTLAEILSAVTRALEETRRRNEVRVERLAPAEPAIIIDRKRGERLLDLEARLRRGEITLPAVPAVLLTLRHQIEDPRSTMDDMARTIEGDPRLAADLLRLANNAHFSRMGRTTSVRDAIGRLGLTHVQNLLRTIFLEGLSVAEGPYQVLLATVWRRSLARALAMRALCELLGPGQGLDADTAYIIGLMADIGSSLLFWIVSQEDHGSLTPEDLRDTASMLTLVRNTHEELGRALTELWKLDKVVSAVIANHHRAIPPTTNASWWALCVVANDLATSIVGEPDPTCAAAPEPHVVVRYATELTLPIALLHRLPRDLAVELAAVEESLGRRRKA